MERDGAWEESGTVSYLEVGMESFQPEDKREEDSPLMEMGLSPLSMNNVGNLNEKKWEN